jgi:hypothetical protein
MSFAAIIHDESEVRKRVKTTSMMVHKKNFLLAVKLIVIRHTEAGEHHLDVWNA